MMNCKTFYLSWFLLMSVTSLSQAERYFQPADSDALKNNFGYVPIVDNPWAPPQAKPAYEPPPVPVYEPPAHTQVYENAQPQSERYISEQELRELESVSEQSDLWRDTAPAAATAGQSGDGYYDEYDGGSRHAGAGYDGEQDAWGRLDTRGLVGNSGYRSPSAGSYAPYSFGVPGMYPPAPGFNSIVPGMGQAWQPNSYYNLTMPRLDTRAMDGINSGSYMNNSIAPFLY